MSLAVISPRDLVLRHGIQSNPITTPVDLKRPAQIGTGNQSLHSFYRPGLAAGTYNVDVKQDIAEKEDGTNPLASKESSKTFTVVAPRYALPAGAIDTVYPPNGHSAPHFTLPHVVLKDPQSPWERVGSEKELETPGKDGALSKCRTPWLAVLVFTHDEISLPDDVISQLTALLKPEEPAEPFKPSTTATINVNISDFVCKVRANDSVCTPLTFDKNVDDPAKTTGDVVFVKRDLLKGLVQTHDINGVAVSGQTHADVSRYKWMAHVRHVDTTGMAGAGSTSGLLGERDSLFSVVVSHRTGPLDIDQPTPIVAHLVSIEGLEAMTVPFRAPYVALSSLHSWTYTSLPPNSLTVRHAFQHIGNSSKDLLRAPMTDDALKKLEDQGPAGTHVANRIQDGFSLTRYRTQTGEQTVAFYQGPLTPANVPYPLRADWGDPSTHGTDRQIFDRNVGIMDITYSAAWQLGKTLAVADRPFTVALARVRKQIQDAGVEERKKQEMEHNTLYQTRINTVKSLVTSMQILQSLPGGDALAQSDVSNRWRTESPPRLDISFQKLGAGTEDESEEHKKKKLQDELNKAAETVSGTLTNASVPYDEFNTPFSTDWLAVLKWVLDRMYLTSIPPHYMINDPSHLPPETIRFFAVDTNWTDALVDGALSLASHLERTDDLVRRAIQHAIKRYLNTPSPGLGRKPPIPKYGFLLRSELVTAFPDMVITTEPTHLPKESEQLKPVLIRHELLDTNVMLCLFDRAPEKGTFESVTLSQPPHQSCFSIASELDSQSLTVSLKPVYTGPVTEQPTGSDRATELPNRKTKWVRGEVATVEKPRVFVWGNDDDALDSSQQKQDMRYLVMNTFATLTHQKVRAGMNEEKQPVKYAEADPTPSLIAYQLNDPNWRLKIVLDEKKTTPGDALVMMPQMVPSTRSAKIIAQEVPTPAVTVAAPERTLLSLGGFKRSAPLLLDLPPCSMVTPVTISAEDNIPKAEMKAQPISPFISFATMEADSSSGPASDPVYAFRVFSIDSKMTDAALIPSKNPQDLIFSITLENKSSAGRFDLEYMSIHIPFIRIPGDDERELLMTDYQGSGAFMITNLRFNPVCSLIKKSALESSKTSLKIELLPRTHLKKVPVKECQDLTFLLNGAVVEKVKDEKEMKLKVLIKHTNRGVIGRDIKIERSRT